MSFSQFKVEKCDMKYVLDKSYLSSGSNAISLARISFLFMIQCNITCNDLLIFKLAIKIAPKKKKKQEEVKYKEVQSLEFIYQSLNTNKALSSFIECLEMFTKLV